MNEKAKINRMLISYSCSDSDAKLKSLIGEKDFPIYKTDLFGDIIDILYIFDEPDIGNKALEELIIDFIYFKEKWIIVFPEEKYQLIKQSMGSFLDKEQRIQNSVNYEIQNSCLEYLNKNIKNLTSHDKDIEYIFRIIVSMEKNGERTMQDSENIIRKYLDNKINKKQITSLGRVGVKTDDPCYDILDILLENGGEVSARLISEKLNIKSEKLNLEKKDIVKFIDNISSHDGNNFLFLYNSNNDNVEFSREYDEILESIQKVQPHRYPPVRVKIKDINANKIIEYSTREIIEIAKDEKRIEELANIIKGLFNYLPLDKIGRPLVYIQKDKEKINRFFIREAFWKIVVLIEIGKKNKFYFADDYEVLKEESFVDSIRMDELFIKKDKFFSLILSVGFTQKALEEEKDKERTILFPIFHFIRLLSILQNDIRDDKREIAAWHLFRFFDYYYYPISVSEKIDRYVSEVEKFKLD